MRDLKQGHLLAFGALVDCKQRKRSIKRLVSRADKEFTDLEGECMENDGYNNQRRIKEKPRAIQCTRQKCSEKNIIDDIKKTLNC